MITNLGKGAICAAAIGAALGMALAGCSRESDRPSRAEAPADYGARTSPVSYTTSSSPTSSLSTAQREAQAPKSDDGKPVWAANRQRSGEDNAEKQFERNGQDFGAANLDDYVRKAHAFVDSPPKGALTTTRSNGDVLYYDPKANVFVVADRQGAPRTMFKPRDGMSYWLQQKQQAAERSTSRGERRSRSGDGSDSSSDESAG